MKMEKIIEEVEDFIVHIYATDQEIKKILDEGKQRGTSLDGPYSATEHPPRTKPGQHHLHVYARGNQLFAINKDGTAHDRSHGVRIPNKVAKALRAKFPDYKIPQNDMIESAPRAIEIIFEALTI